MRALALCVCIACHGHPERGAAPEAPLFVEAPGSPRPVGRGIARPVLADMNGDGALDIVTGYDALSHNGGERGRLAVHLGRGDGTFRTEPIEVDAHVSQMKLAVGDVDGDGHLDVAVGGHDSHVVQVLLGDGTGRLRDAGTPVETGSGGAPHTHSLVLADVDGDRHLDVVASNADANDVSVLLGDGTGSFRHAEGSPFSAGNHPYEGMLVTDVNGDGSPDIVAANLLGASVSVLLGDGEGSFARAKGSPYPVAPRPGSVGVGDVDGDGRVELLATHDNDAVLSVLAATEDGFAPMEGSPWPLEERAWDVRVEDLDGDGRAELILGGVERHVTVIHPDRSRAHVLHPIRGRGPGYLATGDLDGDGRPDVVTGNFTSGELSILLHTAVPSQARSYGRSSLAPSSQAPSSHRPAPSSPSSRE